MKQFWDLAQEDTNGCWNFPGPGQYGRLFKYEGKFQLPHRVAYQLKVGRIPEGMYVCHHCDNGHCVNQEHLFLGTQADNIRDAKQKGRLRAGPGVPKGTGLGRKLPPAHRAKISAGVKRHIAENGLHPNVLENLRKGRRALIRYNDRRRKEAL